MKIHVELHRNVIGCGAAGETVAVLDHVAEALVGSGKASLAPGESLPVRGPSIPLVDAWPENTGVPVSDQETEQLAQALGIKPEWLAAAASRISAAGQVPTYEVLETIAANSQLRRDVMGLADDYLVAVAHAEAGAVATDDARGKGRLQLQDVPNEGQE